MLRDFAASLAAAARSYRRRPAFLAISTITLGLGVAFSTSLFGVVDSALHPPMAFGDPDRTFTVWVWGAGNKVHPGATQDEIFAAVAQVPAFDGVTHGKPVAMDVTVGDRPVTSSGWDRAIVGYVPPGFFDVVRVRPRLGRAFTADDIRNGNRAIVSDGTWRAAFNNRRSIDNAELTIGDQIYSVVGVMPAGMTTDGTPLGADLWAPITGTDSAYWGFPVAHLRAGATKAEAEAQLTVVTAQLNSAYHPQTPYGARLDPLRPTTRDLNYVYKAMIAVALSVLLIACANITTLMLARAIARRRDLALRLSLGASSRVLVFDQLAESLVLAACGAVAALIFTGWGLRLITHSVPERFRWITVLEPHWNWRFFAISLGAIGLTTIVTGLLPAAQVARIQPMEPLKEGSGGLTGRGVERVKFLVSAELALSLTLLVGAAIYARSAIILSGFHFGFDASRVISAKGKVYYRWDKIKLGTNNPVELLEPRIAAVDGIESTASLARGRPPHAQVFSDVTVGIAPLLAEDYLIVGPHFMHTMGLSLIRGRDFEAGDDTQGAVILDERAVPALFPNGNAIGHAIRFGGDDADAPWLRVIGIARRADLWLPASELGPRWPPIYASIKHADESDWWVVARVNGSVPVARVRVTRALHAILPPSTIATVSTFAEGFDLTKLMSTYSTRVFATLGLASLALAAAGLFAVLSYTVNQRMREYAVRIAIGARNGHVLRLALRDGAEMALAGTAIGAFGGIWLGVQLGGTLYGIASIDVVSLVIAEIVLLGVTFAACMVPVTRATKADPVSILRAI